MLVSLSTSPGSVRARRPKCPSLEVSSPSPAKFHSNTRQHNGQSCTKSFKGNRRRPVSNKAHSASSSCRQTSKGQIYQVESQHISPVVRNRSEDKCQEAYGRKMTLFKNGKKMTHKLLINYRLSSVCSKHKPQHFFTPTSAQPRLLTCLNLKEAFTISIKLYLACSNPSR